MGSRKKRNSILFIAAFVVKVYNFLIRWIIVFVRKIIWEHLSFWVVLIIAACFLYKPYSEYKRPVIYTIMEAANDNVNGFVYTVALKFKTKRAFLPYERIDVAGTIIFTPSGEKIFNVKNHQILLVFQNSYQYGTFEEGGDNNSSNMKDFKNPIGEIKLAPTGKNGEYYGIGSIVYSNAGNNVISFAMDEPIPIDNLTQKIEIGSTTEVMNKRTNDLLTMLTIIGIALAFYSEFKKSK